MLLPNSFGIKACICQYRKLRLNNTIYQKKSQYLAFLMLRCLIECLDKANMLIVALSGFQT